jgi:hypothetical protein
MTRTIRTIAAGAGIAIAIWLTGAGAVAAQEGAPATAPAAATPASPGDTGGTDVLPGVAEYVPALPTAMTASTDRWSALSVMFAATGVIASGAAAVAVAVRRRRGVVPWPGGLHLAGAVSLLFAGVAHCALAPSHWAEGWHLGAFFVASGLVLVGQAGLLWLRPSPAAYRSVLVSTAVMVLLYVAVRQFAVPLVDHRDPYLLEDLPVKIAEVVAAVVAVAGLVALRRRTQPVRSETFGSAGATSMGARPVPLPIG